MILMSPKLRKGLAECLYGTWINPLGGDWNDTANWQDGNIASGACAIANFNTLDFTGTRNVNIANATFGKLVVGPASTTANYVFRNDSSSFVWTLNNAGQEPTIEVTGGFQILRTSSSGFLTIDLEAGQDYLVKEGAGTLAFDRVGFGADNTYGLHIKNGTVNTWNSTSNLPNGSIIMGDGTTEVSLIANSTKTSLQLGTRAITLNAGTQTLGLRPNAGLSGSGSAGIISGVGTLRLQRSGAGGNSGAFGATSSNYSGGTTISGDGTIDNSILIALAVNSTFSGGNVTQGPLGTGTVTLDGGGLMTRDASRTLHNNIVVAQDAVLGDGNDANNTRNLTLAGAMTLTGNRALTVRIGRTSGAGKVTISGEIGDDGNGYGLTVRSGGVTPARDVLELTGANTYTGATTITSGVLVTTRCVSANEAKFGNARFSDTALTVTFVTPPLAGETYRIFAGATTQTYGSVTLVDAPGRTGSYDSANSTLTIS